MQLTYGEYGGRFVPETLIPALDELEAGWREARDDPRYHEELKELGRTYAGRPTPLTLAERFAPGKRLYLKREDLLHTGAHKLNNAPVSATIRCLPSRTASSAWPSALLSLWAPVCSRSSRFR